MSTARVHRLHDDDAGALSDEDEAARARGPAIAPHGDTVHYSRAAEDLRELRRLFLYDAAGRAYLDLQMWYSAVNFGYANPRLNDAMQAPARRGCRSWPASICTARRSSLPPHIARDAARKFGAKGRVQFNVGGCQAIEDALKLVRNARKAARA